MTKNNLFLTGMLALALGLVFIGCDDGGGNGNGGDPALTGTVTITGSQVAGQLLTANTDGLDGSGTDSYRWERANSLNGTYTAISGKTDETYTTSVTDDIQKYIRVSVTRAGYSGSISSGAVKIYADSIPTVTGVTVTPDTATVAKGETKEFTANVTGTGDGYSEVTWTVDSSTSSVDSTGKLKVASNETKTTLKVTATSVADSTKKGAATVTILSDGNSGSVYLGETFTITGQVYEVDYEMNEDNWPAKITYSNYTGDLDASSNLGDTGTVTKGQLNITIGTPAADRLSPISDLNSRYDYNFYTDYTGMKISDDSAKFTNLILKIGKYYYSYHLETVSGNSIIGESVDYIYVDKDVTITATGKTNGSSTTTNLNLPLKKGWNTMYGKVKIDSDYTMTVSRSLSNPNNLKWVYD